MDKKKKKLKLNFKEQDILGEREKDPNAYYDSSAEELKKLRMQMEKRRQERMNELDGEDDMNVNVKPQSSFNRLRKFFKKA